MGNNNGNFTAHPDHTKNKYLNSFIFFNSRWLVWDIFFIENRFEIEIGMGLWWNLA